MDDESEDASYDDDDDGLRTCFALSGPSSAAAAVVPPDSWTSTRHTQRHLRLLGATMTLCLCAQRKAFGIDGEKR